jgi:hypothetical protein
MQKAKWFLGVAVLTAAVLILAGTVGLNRVQTSVLAAAPPPISIASCNPTYTAGTAGGSYIVTANLAPASGANCIMVTAPGVTINLNHFTLTGTGAGIGIVIGPPAIGTHVVGGTITGFSTGILDSASSALLEALTIRANAGNGVLMKTANGSVLASSSITGNGANGVYLLNTRDGIVEYNKQISGNGATGPGYGVWIQNNASSTLSYDNIIAANTFGDGGPQRASIWVGVSANALLTCGTAGAPSSGNIIVDNQNINANGAVGIGLQCTSATNNTVTNNHTVTGNATFDLFDGNTTCGENSWVADTFGTSNQSCIH